MKEAVIVSAVRTPIGRYMGALKEVQAYDLAALVLNEVLRRANLKPAWIDDVILGQSYQSGEYVNIARMALLKAGWPESIPGVTMDRRCCTGLGMVCFAAMMLWAETAARKEEITRESCDQWALGSHQKACASIESGAFHEEIIAVPAPRAKGEPEVVKRDENPRPDTSMEALSRLKPVLGGVCTAGNSSTENDGAAAVAVTSREKASELGLKALASLKSFSVVGDDPRRTYKTVCIAAKKALDKAKLRTDQMDLIEIQEAFAAQVLADLKGMMGLGARDYKRVNVNGSGISLGHPIACTGTRVLVTLLHEMNRRKARYGLECICGGGESVLLRFLRGILAGDQGSIFSLDV